MRTLRRPLLVIAAVAAVNLFASAAAYDGKAPAEDQHASGKPLSVAAKASSRDKRARSYFTDLPVVTHEGETLRFFSDVLKDRTVAITFFYVDCNGMCPLVNTTLSLVQDFVGERMGKDIFLITISIDPERDAPERLAEYRKKFDAGDGWLFLTGDKENIDAVTKRLGQTGPKEAHSPLILLGNVKRARWKKVRPNVPAQAIALQLQVLADGMLPAAP